MKKLFFLFTTLEILIITTIIGHISTKASENYEIAPMKTMEIIKPPAKITKYFYEPKPNTTIHDIPLYFSLPYEPVYTINADSLHERFTYTKEKAPNTFRLITLGDSFTFGHYVNTNDNWTERLEDLLNNECKKYEHYDVINLGVFGYDISYAVERFIQRGEKYDPDLVVWLVKSDDFTAVNDITNGKLMKLKEEYIQNGTLKKSIEKGDFYPHTVQVRKAFLEEYGEQNILTMQKNYLETFATYFKNSLVFVSLTNTTKNNEEQLIENFTEAREDTFYYKNFPEFNRLPDKHPSIQGHTEIAKYMLTYLTKEKILPCN